MQNQSRWLTASPTANTIGCSSKSIERAASKGHLSFELVDIGDGRTIKIFDRDEVLAYKAKREAAKNKSATTAAPLLVA